MNLFLKSIIAFLVPIFFVLCLFFISLHGLSLLAIKKTSYLDSNQNFNIFLGDSHVTHSIIDSLLPQTINLATGSEPYYYTFQKIKLLNKKIKIKNVFLGFSYHNLSLYYDDLINGSLSSLFPGKIFYYLDLTEKLRVIYWNTEKLNYLFRTLFKNTFICFKTKTLNFLFADGYVYLESNEIMKKKYLDRRIKEQFYSKNNVSNFSVLNIYYLNQIVSFCKKNKIKLNLLTTPLHKEYINKVPVEFKNKYNKIINQKTLNYIDLQSLEIPDSCFAHDGDHVTNLGADIVTSELKNFFKLYLMNVQK